MSAPTTGVIGSLDERVARGLERQRIELQARVDAGARHVGWKVGLVESTALTRLGLKHGAIGFLTDATVRDSKEPVSLRRLRLPGVEAEIALYVGSEPDHEAPDEDLLLCLEGVGVSAELVDMNATRFDEVEEVVAGNIFHRAAIFGPRVDPAQALRGEDVATRCSRNGELLWQVPVPETRRHIASALRQVAVLAECLGRRIAAGDRIISGSVAPVPVWVRGADRVEVDMGLLGSLQLAFD